MYRFNGTAWVRVSPPSSNQTTANFHGISSVQVDHCSLTSPASSSKTNRDDTDGHTQLRNVRRAPLKQLFPRTPTPFKKAYAAAVQKGGEVEQLDLQKSPELFEDLKEIILKDVILPPPKRSRRTLHYNQLFTSDASTSASYVYDDRILDTTTTPSKILNDSSFLMSPPIKCAIPVSGEAASSTTASSTPKQDVFMEPRTPPLPMSTEWIRIACGRTSAQVEMEEMARRLLLDQRSDDSRLL